MLDIHAEHASLNQGRQHDISSWQKFDVQRLNKRGRKHYYRRKAAITAYFTTDQSVEEIATAYHLSVEQLVELAEQCLMRHEDGTPWGFRILAPGTHIAIPKAVTPENAATTTIERDSVDAVVHAAVTEPSDEQEADVAVCVEEADEAAEAAAQVSSDVAPLPSSEQEETIADRTDKLPSIKQEDAPSETADSLPLSEQEDAETDTAATLLSTEPDEESATLDDQQAADELAESETEQQVAADELAESEAEQQEKTVVVEEEIPDRAGKPSLVAVGSLILQRMGKAIPARISPVLPTVIKPVATSSKLLSTALAARYARRRQVSGATKHSTGPWYIASKRRRRAEKDTSKRKLHRLVSIGVLVVIMLGILLPLGAGLTAYNLYNSVSTMAHDGINHLLTVKTLLPISKDDPTAALNPDKLQQAQKELAAAEKDFTDLQLLVNRPDVQEAVNQFSPDYSSKLIAAKHLVQVALDVSRMGQEVSNVGLIAARIIHGSPLADSSSKPLISTADISTIQGTLVHALYYIDDIQLNMSQVNLKDIPINDKQKTQLVGLLDQLPQARDLISQAQELVPPIAWLLGVGSQRRFLVQTMDRAELRPSGGFTGQYGILQIQDGSMAPFNLRDVALLDYAGNGIELGRPAPPEYRNWMNFGNWGLRDSNLSADYPTTARLSMKVFEEEGGGPVDGDISFTPTFIGHILDVTGPIRIDEYNETITSKNLEDRLHFYQQDYSAIAIQREKTGDNSHAVRKAFTSLVGKTLLDHVRHLPTKKLLDIIKGAVKDLQSRDLEIYFTDPTAEQWLVEHGYSGAMNTFSKQDGFMVVQANISISKASQYVHTTEHDDVVLDNQGGATHTLTITLDYRQTGPVYGFDTYADYIRVYVPQSAQFLWGDGFDTGQALCKPTQPPPNGNGGTSGTGGNKDNKPAPPQNDCAQYKTSFPSDARYCPSGNYSLGDRLFHEAWPIDRLGSPTALTSDLPGRAMWGGLTVTPKNCTSYITLSWYVPHAVKQGSGQPTYSLLVQKQGGYIPTVEINVNTDSFKKIKPWKVSSDVVADRLFS
ncbi:MAG TPA: DUF4012 domain-containing protein [Ktedonobacteraceae bacterium]|nr:DUF4012 domain-containing protein [Ktedonobacteraceae bacterium]